MRLQGLVTDSGLSTLALAIDPTGNIPALMYRIFDQCISSDIPLPELEPCEKAVPDINFSLSGHNSGMESGGISWLHHWTTPEGEAFCSCGMKGDEYVLRFHALLDFFLSKDQRDITCLPLKEVPLGTIRHLLIDQVVPRILGHWGNLVVHGSAVSIDGKAVAFLGRSGIGKSTLAAYLHKQGHTILTDDCFKLNDEDPTGISITPNYPGVRLFDDSSDAVFANSPANGVAHYTRKKRLVIASDKSAPDQTLAAIFFLSPLIGKQDNPVATQPVHGLQRIIKLVECSFGLYGGTNEELRKHFLRQGSLANSCTSFLQLSHPHRYDQLPAVRRRILEVLDMKEA